MSIKHHLSKEQARQLSEEFGVDWHWSYSGSDRDAASLQMTKFNRYSPRVKAKDMRQRTSATSRSVSCFKKKHPSENNS